MRNIKRCKCPECSRKHYAKGYCRNHYRFYSRYGLEPTPENENYINERKKAKISVKMTKKKKKIIEYTTLEQFKADGRMEILPFLMFFTLELEEYKKNQQKSTNKHEKKSIRENITKLEKEIKEIQNFMSKKEVRKEEVKIFKEKLEMKYVKEKNEKYIQMKI